MGSCWPWNLAFESPPTGWLLQSACECSQRSLDAVQISNGASTSANDLRDLLRQGSEFSNGVSEPDGEPDADGFQDISLEVSSVAGCVLPEAAPYLRM